MEMITVLIVDDHPVAREGLRAMLAMDPQIQVVGEAVDGQEALERVAELRPRVVLMDIRLPRLDGLEAAHRIKDQYPATAIIMMTSYEDDALIVDAVRAGAAGYLLKNAPRDLLRHTIGAVASGGLLIKETLLRKALSGFLQTPWPSKGGPGELPSVEELTERERTVLRLLAEGKTNKEIAAALVLAEVTVKKHVQSIIAKLRASDRTHAAITGMRLGLLK